MDNPHLGELEPYVSGQCHVLAVALHRHLGWSMVAVISEESLFWEDPDDPDNGIPEVIHVYAVDSQNQAWDIRGARPAEQIRSDAAEWFVLSEEDLSTDWLRGENELTVYVGTGVDEHGNEFDRPLFTYTDEDVAQAWACAQAVLSQHPSWPSSSYSARRSPAP